MRSAVLPSGYAPQISATTDSATGPLVLGCRLNVASVHQSAAEELHQTQTTSAGVNRPLDAGHIRAVTVPCGRTSMPAARPAAPARPLLPAARSAPILSLPSMICFYVSHLVRRSDRNPGGPRPALAGLGRAGHLAREIERDLRPQGEGPPQISTWSRPLPSISICTGTRGSARNCTDLHAIPSSR